jgi:creatinine amidohydrolase
MTDHDEPILYVQKGSPTITEMSGADVQAMLQKTDVVLIPVGATEDHGAHLPLGTDAMEAREICRRRNCAKSNPWSI